MRRYDAIGTTYSTYRRADPRIAAQIDLALGDSRRIVDVGSGTGSYEPARTSVVAVEPSPIMIAQRPAGAAPVIRAVAEQLPFRDGAFDAALAILTVHHWRGPHAGLAELARVAPRQVVLTWDPQIFARFWFVADYLPELAEIESDMATLATVVRSLDVVDIREVAVPADCTDGFCGAYWRRPRLYLEPAARHAISGFSLCPPAAVERAVRNLEVDLRNGTWARRYEHLEAMDRLDVGYRLVVGRSDPSRPIATPTP